MEKKQRRKVYFITGLEASIEVQMGQERHNFTFIEPKVTWRKMQRQNGWV